MSKKEPLYVKALTVIGYIVGSFFLGAIAIGIIEGLGDWYTRSLRDTPLWRWWLFAIITGLALVGIWKAIERIIAEVEEHKNG